MTAALLETPSIHADLNPHQQQAVLHGNSPLLIVAGAGTGKTKTLVHRVAHLIETGTAPARILLLTFTRRAAREMLRRTDALIQQNQSPAPTRRRSASPGSAIWGGTFHSIATRLLRIHGHLIGLDPGFTIHDRGDSEDLLDVVRTDLDLAKTDKRFPKKGTCLAIYSHTVNSGRPLKETLADHFPWCIDYEDDLKQLFQGYCDRKEDGNALDYDDLLLFWRGLVEDPVAGEQVRSRFDCVLVDEYQDTNRLQADILKGLTPDGTGLTVVGDDAQSIYSFRAATVRNILGFPQEFPGTTTVMLEQNYRSTQPILTASNAVMAHAAERFTKDLWSQRESFEKPALVTCEDETDQADYLVRQILERREEGVDLRQQAVLFRASHHSILLEAELARRNVPFVKYGGLKFIETAHIKDLTAFLRLAENPRDVAAALRVFQLLPGIGPKRARQFADALLEAGGEFGALANFTVPSATVTDWPKLIDLMERLGANPDLQSQVRLAREFYTPFLEQKFDHAEPRLLDLEQLEQVAVRSLDRQTFLSEMALDPPQTSEDFAGEPLLDEDFLILSTIHSAKGLEWDSVYVIHAADGNIPSDLATRNEAEIEEERRLFYVALTRAKNRLCVLHPQRYFHAARGPKSDAYGHALLTRFIGDDVKPHFERRATHLDQTDQNPRRRHQRRSEPTVRQQVRAMWAS